MPQLSSYPDDRMGVYKRPEEIPEHHQLGTFSEFYQERTPWEAYLASYLVPPCDSESKEKQAERAFRKWNAVVAEHDRHYALCELSDVETWSASLLADHATGYAISIWSQIDRFYNWLLTHPDHPHTYQPFRMAAARTGSAAHEIWTRSIITHWEVRE